MPFGKEIRVTGALRRRYPFRRKRSHFHTTPVEELECVLYYLSNLIDTHEINASPDDVFTACLGVVGDKRAYEMLKPLYPKRLDPSDSRDMSEWGIAKLDLEEQLSVVNNVFRKEFDHISRNLKGRKNPELTTRLLSVAEVFSLSVEELAILELFYILEANSAAEIFKSSPFDMTEFQSLQSTGHKILGLDRRKFLQAIKDGCLFNAQLLDFDDGSIRVNPGIRKYLVGLGDRKLSNTFFDRNLTTHLKLPDFGIPQPDLQVVKALLQSRKGCNILFYGRPGTGKTSLAACLAKELGLDLYQVKASDDEHTSNFRAQAIYATMSAAQGKKSVVLVDEADDLLNTQVDFKTYGSSTKGWLNNILDSNNQKVIWITNHSKRIDASSMRRFAFSLEFEKLTNKHRMTVLSYELKKHGFAKFFTSDEMKDLCKRFSVDASGMVHAVNVLKIKKGMKKENVVALFESVLKNHEKATTGKESFRKPKELKQYSLEGLNTSQDLSQIVSVVKEFSEAPAKNGPKSVTLLLYGPPGTGKSEFVHYLGKELGKDVLLKHASDIQDPYVGMTEKNIAQAFHEAQQEKSILFFDEADTFLFPRKDAMRSWEKSFTNEILGQLDGFSGIAVFATNDIEGLDHAAIRRFKFKVRFSALTPEGNLHFYRTMLLPMAPVADVLSADHAQQLRDLRNLTPGDYAVVRDQFSFNSTNESEHQSLINALRFEVEHKKATKTVGF